ncbi:MAG TPA: hypothetical protein VGM94_00030 [Galbitalea sp.]|jgi:hypothetical protein
MNTQQTNPNRYYGPAFLRLDLPRGAARPSAWRWVLGTAIAVGASLLACFGLAWIAVAVSPGLAGYGHFQFGDYSKLTIVGVIVACIGWPTITWFTTQARRLYLWLAIAATVVSLAPDAWIFHLGQPPLGVATLVVMHFALAVITYPAMVFIAPQRVTVDHVAHA